MSPQQDLSDSDKVISEMRNAYAVRLDGKLTRHPDGYDNFDPRVKELLEESGVFSFDLMTLRPGEVYVIKTESSTFWVTRTLRSRPPKGKSDMIRGVMVQTNSSDKAWISNRSPEDTHVGKIVTVGKSFIVGRRRAYTSKVVAHGRLGYQ